MRWNWIGWMAVILAAGCASETVADEPGDARDATFIVDGKADAFGVTEGSALADGVLRLVNTATEELLDDEVMLDARASAAIVAHRDGPDAQLGTGDDDLIDSLEELDNIPWVGSSAFQRLVTYARDHGYVDYAVGSPEQVLPGPTESRRNLTSTLLDDGRPLILGGYGDDGALLSGEVYDPAQQAWTATAPMSTIRTGATATVLDDGRVLVAGGLAPGSEYGLNSAEIWDSVTDTWSDAGTFDGGRYDHTATKLDDGRVVLIGGKSSYRAYTHIDVSVYDPATNSWTKTGVTPVGVDGHTATLAPDGTVLIVGGYNRFNKYRTRAVMQFDPATDQVDVVTHIDVARDQHAALIVGDELWIIGGVSDHDRAIASVEAIHLQTHEVRTLPPLISARRDHTATTLPNGDLIVLGGVNESGFRGLREVDMWNPTRGEWELGPALQTSRHGGASFVMPDGVLSVGGETPESVTPASTLYLGGSSTAVSQPPTETIVDWLLLPHFGERFSCGPNELVFHEASAQLICFKGREAENTPIGTHAWTPNGWVEILDASHSPVPPRTLHSMTYDAARGKVVMFGGQKRYGYDLDDVWEFDGTSWTEVQPADAIAPPPQRQAEFVFDSARNRSVLLPGRVDGTIINDMYAWDGTRWSVVPQTNPQHFGTDAYDARRGYDASYDAARDRIVIFGGWANGRATPTMEFDGQTWTSGGSGGPGSGGQLDSVFDAVTGTILVAGTMRTGNSGNAHGVWRYDGNWSTVSTEFKFSAYQWRQGVTYTPDLGVVIGGGSLRQLGEYTTPNQRPTIRYVGQRTIYPNEPFSLTLDAADPDGHPIEVTANGLPDGASFDPNTLTLTWTPRADQGGEYSVSFTATDGALATTSELSITVEGLITYPMLPTGTIDMSGGVTMTGTVKERRRNGYEHRSGSFPVLCDFTGQKPDHVLYTCKVVNASRWPYDYTVLASGQLRPDGKIGSSSGVSGYIEALQWDDYEIHITRVDVSWQQGQELWSASGDYKGYLDQN